MSDFDPRLMQLSKLLSRLEEAQLQRPPVAIDLPNLQFQEWLFEPIEIRRSGSDIEVLAHIANTGRADSGSFDIVSDVTINIASATGIGTITTSVASLRAGALDTHRITVIGNLPRNRFLSVSTQVWLDAPTDSPAWGSVVESNETDNYRSAFLGFPPLEPPPKPNGGL